MSKPANLSDAAHAALTAHKQSEKESLSQVILRFVPPPVKTFADLERHLENLEGPVVDLPALERLRKRKSRGSRAR